MVRRTASLALLLVVGALSQEQQPPAAPVRCPLVNSGFNELSAVGQLLLARGETAVAEACLLEAVANTLPVLRVLSDVAANRGDFGRAASFSQLLEMMDDSGETKLLHAQRLLQNAEDKDAAKRTAALLATPAFADNAEVHHLHGIASFRLGDAQRALAHLQRATALEPANGKHAEMTQQIAKRYDELASAAAAAAAAE